jgi:hypothetical protein
MTKIIGMLPASGSASRLLGIPKFLLPVENGKSLLQRHVEMMNEVCDEVRIATRERWHPLLEDLKLNATIYYMEPSTMADALINMDPGNSTIVVGMPDVYVGGSNRNFYKSMLDTEGDVVLATWNYIEEKMKGKLGQVLTNDYSRVLNVLDKHPTCEYPEVWGAIVFRNEMIHKIDRSGGSVLSSVNEWIDKHDVDVTAVKIPGEYIDAGTIRGLVDMYHYVGKSL